MKANNILKKNRILILLLAMLILLGASAFALLSAGGYAAPMEIPNETNENRSRVLLTGTGFELSDKAEADQIEEQRRAEERQAEEKKTDPSNDRSASAEQKSESREDKENNTLIKIETGNLNTQSGTAGGNNGNSAPTANQGDLPGGNSGSPSEPDPNGGTDVPGENGEEDPSKNPLIITDLVDGKIIDGNYLSFYVEAKSYKGYKITYDHFEVYLNGDRLYGGGPNEYHANYTKQFVPGDYSPPVLNSGQNIIVIKVDDGEGHESRIEYGVTVNGTELEYNSAVSIRIEAGNLGLGVIASNNSFLVYQGEKVANVVIRFLEESGLGYSTTGTPDIGFYLKRIYKPGITDGYAIPANLLAGLTEKGVSPMEHEADSLGEKDFYEFSGWMYSMNGYTPGYGMSGNTVREGDEIHLWFTLDLGNDEGGIWNG